MAKPAVRRIRLSEIMPTPWKNGGGTTREIATGAAPDATRGWGWRLSVAEVAQDGPFSIFPGTDRVIAVIEGAGMDLVAPDGATVALDPFRPVAFPGEEAFTGRLRGGPVRDLNAMVLRTHFEATMDIHSGPRIIEMTTAGGGCLAIVCLSGSCSVCRVGGAGQELLPGDILLDDGESQVELDLADDGRAAVIQIRRRIG